MILDFRGVTLKDPDIQSPYSWQNFSKSPTSSEDSPVIYIYSKFLLAFASGDFFLRKFVLETLRLNAVSHIVFSLSASLKGPVSQYLRTRKPSPVQEDEKRSGVGMVHCPLPHSLAHLACLSPWISLSFHYINGLLDYIINFPLNLP